MKTCPTVKEWKEDKGTKVVTLAVSIRDDGLRKNMTNSSKASSYSEKTGGALRNTLVHGRVPRSVLMLRSTLTVCREILHAE